MKEFKYLGTVLCKHEEMEGVTRERAVESICVIVSVMRGMNVSMDIKRGLKSSILMPK